VEADLLKSLFAEQMAALAEESDVVTLTEGIRRLADHGAHSPMVSARRTHAEGPLDPSYSPLRCPGR